MAYGCIIMLICYLKLLQLLIHICDVLFYITEAELTNESCSASNVYLECQHHVAFA